MAVVQDLTIRRRREDEILGYCPVCKCADANFNVKKLVWNCWHQSCSGTIDGGNGYHFEEVEEVILDVDKIRKLYANLADRYYNNLSSKMVDYLKNRGLKQETIDKFKLGFCSATQWLEEYTDKIGKDAGVIREDYPILSNRLVIPYVVNGEVIDLRGRVLETIFSYKDHTPTYISLEGSYVSRGANYFFNHDLINTSDTIIITEGEFKAIIAIQHGFPVVATPGITRWNDEWNSLFINKHVILAADNEYVIGRRTPCYIQAKVLRNKIPHLEVATLFRDSSERKMDIDSLILKFGAKEFERSIKGARPVDEYLYREGKINYGKY